MVPPEQLMSGVHALTVIVLVKDPAPRLAADAGKTVAWPVFGPVITGVIPPTAGPVDTILMTMGPEELVTVAVTIWAGGVLLVPVEAKVSVLVESVIEPMGPLSPPPPPPHAASAKPRAAPMPGTRPFIVFLSLRFLSFSARISRSGTVYPMLTERFAR